MIPATLACVSSTTGTTDAWTTRRLLAWMADAFKSKGLDSPKLCAELLLAHVLECERLRLYMDADRPASADERDTLRGLVGRALKHEPIQYLVGEWPFFGMPITCDNRALIPRPSTETIVEHVLQHARRPGAAPVRRIADVCTGSGCIAVALARHLKQVEIVATDVSAAALALAEVNVHRHGLTDRVSLREGHLLEPLGGDLFDLIVSNPPYIPDHEWDAVEPNVKDHEPHLALRGGPDGLDLVRGLIDGAGERLVPGGWLLIELATCHASEAAVLARAAGYDNVVILDDIEGHPRVLVGQRR